MFIQKKKKHMEVFRSGLKALIEKKLNWVQLLFKVIIFIVFSLIIKYLCFFLLSAIIESNQKINFEEDILRLKLDYIDTKTNSNKNDFFGIVQKAIKLKEDDSRVMEVVKTNLKTLSTSQNVPSYSSSFTTKDEYYKNQFQIYEFYISVKFRRYIDTKQLPIDYEVKHFLD